MRTPWGDADQLRARMLRPGPSAPREVRERNQRERLFGATVAAVAERGYDALTVADLVSISGVSRSSFYQHFGNKRECFLAAVDAIDARVMERVNAAYAEGGGWDARLRRALDAFVEMVVAQPEAARMCMIESYAAGPDAVERVERMQRQLERLTRDALKQSPHHAGLPNDVVRAIVGGIRKVVLTRLRRGEEGQLPALVPGLWQWALSYTTPPAPIRRSRRRTVPPGTPRFVAEDAEQRMIAAVAEAATAKGYAAMTVGDVVEQASSSWSTFYAHFASKEEAFLAALEMLQARSLEVALPAFEGASDWPHAVRAGLQALLAFLSLAPTLTYIGAVEVFAAGREGLERHDVAIDAFQTFLQPGYERAPTLTPLAAEAIGGGIFWLLFDHVRRRGAERVREIEPVATFVALAPFIGSPAACAVATES